MTNVYFVMNSLSEKVELISVLVSKCLCCSIQQSFMFHSRGSFRDATIQLPSHGEFSPKSPKTFELGNHTFVQTLEK